MKTNLKLGLIAAAVMAVNGMSVHAQDGTPSLQLEEVLVTARKREESLQDVSVAVSAVTAMALEDAHIRDSAELVKLVPSLTLGQGNGESFVIRGIGTQAFSAGVEPSVSTMIDGVVLGRPSQSFMQLIDIQRVEVLRGPQGSLFGKNSSGGVVHFITKDPSQEFESQISATAVERGEYRLGGSISAPLTDTLGARLTYGGVRDDGYLTNVYDGEKYGGGDTDNVRFKLLWEPSDVLSLKWSSDYATEDDTQTVRPLRIVDDPAVAEEILPVVASEDNFRVNLDDDIFKEVDTFGHSLEINWDIGDYTLTSISAYREREDTSHGDQDGRPVSAADFSQFPVNNTEQLTQELRVSSPALGNFRYVAGVFAFLQTVDQEFTRTIGNSVTVADYSVDTTNYAAFGELTYDFTDTIRGLVGGRYTYDELEYTFQRDGNISIPPAVAPFTDGIDDSNFSGKLALEWDFLEDAMVYVSYAEGYKGAAFNVTFATTPPLDPVDPELSTTYELGLKSWLFDRRVMLNAALFRTDYEDFQGQTVVLDDNRTAFFLTNAGEVRTQGLEVDFTALLTENLTLSGGFALIDATIEEFEDGPCSFGQLYREECEPVEEGSRVYTQDLSGGDMPFSPDWKVTLNANYTIPLPTMPFDLVAKLAYQGQDETLMDITQDEYTQHSGYNLFDLALTMEANDSRWNATVFVKNLTDEHYATSISSIPVQLNPGAYQQGRAKNSRRTAGVEVRYYWF